MNRTAREQDWPVRVFRQAADGWERLRSKTHHQGRILQVRAIPRKDCFVLPRLQIRVRIDASDKPTVIRRRRCLLIYSQQQRVRVLVLQFKNTNDCTAFTDQWLSLNPPSDKTISPSVEEQSLDAPEVQHYLFRLLHDPAFVQFCRKLSAHLQSQPDGLAALRALDEDLTAAVDRPPSE